MPETIRARIAWLTGGLALLVFISFGLFLYISLRWQLYGIVDLDLRVHADDLLQSLEIGNGQVRFDQVKISALQLQDDDIAQLTSPTGLVLDRLGEEFIPGAGPPENPRGEYLTFRFQEAESPQGELEEEVFRVLIVPITEGGEIMAYLQVGRQIEDIQAALILLTRLLMLSGPVMVAVAAAGGYWLAGRALTPIEKIRLEAASIQARNMHRRLVITQKDEVGRLAQTMNELLDRLEASFLRQRRFTADASHELRTPLSVIRGEVDVALDRPRTPDEYIHTLQSVESEAQRMSRLVNELLLLARADANELHLEYEKVDLAELLRLLADLLQNQAQEAGVCLKTDLPPSLTLSGDRDRLLELFLNLLENAFVHAPGSQVEIRALQEGEWVVATICDSGPGIPPEHLPHIFERFYRGDPVRERGWDDSRGRDGSRGKNGSGLGLAIANEIAQAHGGRINVESEPGKGTTFKIELPCCP